MTHLVHVYYCIWLCVSTAFVFSNVVWLFSLYLLSLHNYVGTQALKAAMRVVSGGRPEIDAGALGGPVGTVAGGEGSNGDGSGDGSNLEGDSVGEGNTEGPEEGGGGSGGWLELPGMRDLLQRSWHQDPSIRPKFIDILEFLEGLVA